MHLTNTALVVSTDFEDELKKLKINVQTPGG